MPIILPRSNRYLLLSGAGEIQRCKKAGTNR
jgi:hypothetical protein